MGNTCTTLVHAPLDVQGVAFKILGTDGERLLGKTTTVTFESTKNDDSTPNGFSRKRRGSVSAEVPIYGKGRASMTNSTADGPPKTLDAEPDIVKALGRIFLFDDMDDEQKKEVVGAMTKVTFTPGAVIIKEGEEGDNFYVIQEGRYSAAKGDVTVHTYEGKGFFGELALMYNAPRAATVKAETDGVAWAMDRATFQDIVLASRMDRRQRYEEVLCNMEVLSPLTSENRAAIADCLQLERYEDGQNILTEGEPLMAESKFYLIEAGSVDCFKTFEGEKKLMTTMAAGGFFGEVALVTHGTYRAADCVARGTTKVLTLGRDAFERLMGPAEEILEDKVNEYIKLNMETRANMQELASLDKDPTSAGLKRTRGYSLI